MTLTLRPAVPSGAWVTFRVHGQSDTEARLAALREADRTRLAVLDVVSVCWQSDTDDEWRVELRVVPLAGVERAVIEAAERLERRMGGAL